MKKLVLLLSVLLALSSFTSSPVLASRLSFEYRIQSIVALFCRNVFPFSGVIVLPEEVIPLNGSGDSGPKLGGDADDLANGRANDSKLIIKGSNEDPNALIRGNPEKIDQ